MWLELGAVAGLAALAYATVPLWRRDSAAGLQQLSLRLAEQERQRDLAYRDLIDLDYDHSVGKINDGDYSFLLSESRARAATLLRQIDQLRPLVELERSRIAANGRSEIREPLVSSAVQCPSCKRPVEKSAKFCSNCGARIVADGKRRRSVKVKRDA